METGGTENHVLTLITALDRLGLCSGEIVAPPGPFCAQCVEAGIKHTPFSSATKGITTAFRTFKKAYLSRVSSADLVHVHGSPDLLLCTAIARRQRRPRVLTIHGFHGRGAAASYRFAALVGNRVADALICVAGSEERLLLKAGVVPNKLHRVYNGVADPYIPTVDSSAPKDTVHIAFIGRLSPVKGVDVLLRAMAALTELAGQSVTLDIMGVGEDAEALQMLAHQMGLAHLVTFHGYCPDAASRLAECDIFCLPSREDMGPLVCVEAMAQAKPIVSTWVGGIPEMVIDGETGILVPSDDVPALTQALTTLVKDAERRRTMGQAGRQRYEACFTREGMGQHTYEVYRSILHGS